MGGRSFPRVPEVGGSTGMFSGSSRLNQMHSTLPGGNDMMMMQSLPGGFGTLDTRMLGNTLNGKRM